jgi:Leucine-rich repeat (LRR) protein
MDSAIKTLYNQLLEEYTSEKLRILSASIISAYQNKQYAVLVKYARRLSLDGSEDKKNLGKIFVTIIKHYHPDKLAVILANIKSTFEKKELKELEKFACIIGMKGYIPREEKNISSSTAFEFEVDKERVFTKDDFYQYEESNRESYDDYAAEHADDADYASDNQEEEDESEEEYEVFGFMEAINEEMLGNFASEDMIIHPKDLIEFEELILSDRGIEDLSGIEYCHNLSIIDLSDNAIIDLRHLHRLTNLSVLDLSGNLIESINPLSSLENLISLNAARNGILNIHALRGLNKLISLDISSNKITDISILLELESLQYVNLKGNKIKDIDSIKVLQAKGVEVAV